MMRSVLVAERNTGEVERGVGKASKESGSGRRGPEENGVVEVAAPWKRWREPCQYRACGNVKGRGEAHRSISLLQNGRPER